jgi:hypothetical protein
MAKPGNMAVDGADPRVYDQMEKEAPIYPDADSPGNGNGFIKPQHRKLHDTAVSFEEYHYYAKQTRVEEENHPRHGRETSLWSLIFPSKSDAGVERQDPKRNFSNPNTRAIISDEEWTNASRALRTATRGAAFYLITTDILGPFGLPYAFATMGWG